MSNFGKQIRLNRILGSPDHRPLIIAFDHGLPLGPIPGTTDPVGQVKKFVESGVDAVLLNPGMIQHCLPSLLHPNPPALIMRIDWSSLWTPLGINGKLRSASIASPEHALRSGADAVLTYLLMGTGDVEFEAGEIARNAQIARECEQVGIPLIVESLARGKNLVNPATPELIMRHTRIAVELGADVIKTEYTGDQISMAKVVELCPVPVMVLGGERKNSDDDALRMLRELLESGARGVFFGRNVFQAPDVLKFLRTVRSVLNGKRMDARVDEALSVTTR